METKTASMRLRRAFRYPEDTHDIHESEVMDEEEQERLIEDLKKQNDSSNDIWLKCLLILDGLCFLIFVPLFFQAYSRQIKLVCILALTSTAMTGYVLLFVPTSNTKLAIFPQQEPSPAQRFVPYLNALLSLLIGISGVNWKDRPGTPDGFLLASWMPLSIFFVVVVARRLLLEVNPDELWNLKYELKGA